MVQEDSADQNPTSNDADLLWITTKEKTQMKKLRSRKKVEEKARQDLEKMLKMSVDEFSIADSREWIKSAYIRPQKRKRTIRRNQRGIIYILATLVVFLFLMGLIWFTLWMVITPIAESVTPIVNSYHTESWPLYTQLQYALTFMTNFWQYFLALAFFGLALWVYMYSQHRGQQY